MSSKFYGIIIALTFALIGFCTYFEIDSTWPTVGFIVLMTAYVFYDGYNQEYDNRLLIPCRKSLTTERLYNALKHLKIDDFKEPQLEELTGAKEKCITLRRSYTEEYFAIFCEKRNIVMYMVSPKRDAEAGNTTQIPQPRKTKLEGCTEVSIKYIEKYLTNYAKMGKFFEAE